MVLLKPITQNTLLIMLFSCSTLLDHVYEFVHGVSYHVQILFFSA